MESGLVISLISLVVEVFAFIGACALIWRRRSRPDHHRTTVAALVLLTVVTGIATVFWPMIWTVDAPENWSAMGPVIDGCLVAAVVMPIVLVVMANRQRRAAEAR